MTCYRYPLSIAVLLLFPTVSFSQSAATDQPRVRVAATRTASETQSPSIEREATRVALQPRPQPRGVFSVRNGIGILQDDGTMVYPGKALNFGSGITHRYTPSGLTRYNVTANVLSFEDPVSGRALLSGDAHPQTPYVNRSFIQTDLGLSFPIGSSTYSKAYVSQTGAIVFSSTGLDMAFNNPIFGPWDFNSFFPIKHWGPTIAVLAEPFDYLQDASISIRNSSDHVTITWTNVRSRHSATPNTFQAQLFQNGSVLMSYKSINVDHGGIGIYSGTLGEESLFARAAPSGPPNGPSYLGIKNASLSLLGDALVKFEIQTTGTLPVTGAAFPAGESYSFHIAGVAVIVQSTSVFGATSPASVFASGPWSIVGFLSGIAESVVISGDTISFIVPNEVFRMLGNQQSWSVISSYTGRTVAQSGSASLPTTPAPRVLPSLGQPSLNTSAVTFDYFPSSVNTFFAREAIVAHLGSASVDNYYFFPLRYSYSLPHWQLAGASAKPSGVMGLGGIEYFNDGGCNCHWGIEFVSPGELLLAGDTAYYPLSHEIAHQWTFYADYIDGNGQRSNDWRTSTFSCTGLPVHLNDTVQNISMFQNTSSGGSNDQLVSRSVMGGTARDTNGRQVPYELFGFSPLELYLMGLASPTEVSPITTYDSQGRVKSTISIDSIIAANGPRLPAYDGSIKTIRIPMIVVVPQNEDIAETTLNNFVGLIQNWKARFERETGGRAKIDTTILPPTPPQRPVTSVSAASFNATRLASESIVAAFGTGLATATQIADSVPLPTSLSGTSVKVKDSSGVERFAPLFFVAPTQINYQIPPSTNVGEATTTIISGDGSVSTGKVNITVVAPGMFSVNSSGQGLAAGLVLRVKANGAQSYEQIARFDATQNKVVAVPVDLGPDSDQVFLVLFGTGIRFRSSLSMTTAQIGGAASEVFFAGSQGSLVGVDQVNLRIPRSLARRSEVDVVFSVDGVSANTVRVNIK